MLAAPPMAQMTAQMRHYRPQTQHTSNTIHAPPVRSSQNNAFGKNNRPSDVQGPPVTVFVGNITDRAPDAMIRHILAACGPVVTWKRVQGIF